MTVSSEVKRKDYAGNGSTTNFATVFRFLQNSDVKVILTVDTTAVETVQVLDTDYTLTGAGLDAGGTVIMTIAPATGETLTVKRDVPLTQGTDYIENDEFPADSHEDALDKLTMITQQIQEEIDRSLKLSESQISTGLNLPIPKETNILQWDANDDLQNIDPISLGIINSNVVTREFLTVAAMVADSGLKVGDKARTLGYLSENDGGGNTYSIVAAATGTADGGTFINLTGITGQAKGLFPGDIANIKQYGATADGVTDDAAAFNAIIAIQPVIHFSAGKYRFNSLITHSLPNSGVPPQDTDAIASLTITGDGADQTILFWPSTAGMAINFSSQQHSVHFSDFSMTTGAENAGNGIKVTNSFNFFGTFVAQSDFTRVTFRGDDGYANVKFWTECISIANVSDINFDGVNFYATSDGTKGTGISISQPGAGCFAADPNKTCGTVYNFVHCNWSFLGTGLIVGVHTQTVQIVNSFFAQCTTSISVPEISPNTLQGLSLSNNTFFALGNAINIQSDLPNFICRGNLITVNTAQNGIFIKNSNNFTITGNQFIPHQNPNDQASGIEITSTTAGSIGVIDGNTFSSVKNGVVLGASSSGVKVGINNHFTGLTTDVNDLGTGNIAALTHNLNGLRSADPTGGIGYQTGAGGTVTQITNKNTAVTLNKVCGSVTTAASALGAGAEAAFTFNNSEVVSTDIVMANVGNGNYKVHVTDTAAGSFSMRLKNDSGGSLSDAVTINFAIYKAVTA